MNNHTYTIYNSLVKRANQTPKPPANTQGTNTATGGTRIPYFQSRWAVNPVFVGGPDEHIVKDLQRYGLPMTPASSGIKPPSLTDAETQLRRIQNNEKSNQRHKEEIRQNLDAYFARLTALNDANKAAGRPEYTPTAQDLYAPFINIEDQKAVDEAAHRMYKDRLLNSAAYLAASKGTPYNPAEINRLRASIPHSPKNEQTRRDETDEYELSEQNRWKYVNFGLNSFHPYWNSLNANFERRMPVRSLYDYSENAEEE